jgi:long-chain acyl-CoA synthetase
VDIPSPIQSVLKSALTAGQMGFYRHGMKVVVHGKEHIPYDRPTIVAANHASHLDMGLIKYALGNYGQELVALAAKDYFFEGKWRRTYFENLTNLRPLDRGSNPREAMREASGLIESGKTILLFPEGTRSSSGEIAGFKPAVAYLALRHQVDILPVYAHGTHHALPRGAFLPKSRKLEVRIGAPIPASALQAAADEGGLRISTACARAALVVQEAVEALRDENRFHLQAAIDRHILVDGQGHADGKTGSNSNGKSEPAPPPKKQSILPELFSELEGRFEKSAAKEKVTYYFSLGAGPEGKWTVTVAPEGCQIENKKMDGKADCVMKTDVGMFRKIVRDHYIPQVSEFMDGTVKTNDPNLLTEFVRVFNL